MATKIAKYSTLLLAQQACIANDQCNAVTDYHCDGEFWTCQNPDLISSTVGSCSWLKGTKIGILITVHVSNNINQK